MNKCVHLDFLGHRVHIAGYNYLFKILSESVLGLEKGEVDV